MKKLLTILAFITTYAAHAQGQVVPGLSQYIIRVTGGIVVPYNTIGGYPGTPENGSMMLDDDSAALVYRLAGAWTRVATMNDLRAAVISGGGGGGTGTVSTINVPSGFSASGNGTASVTISAPGNASTQYINGAGGVSLVSNLPISTATQNALNDTAAAIRSAIGSGGGGGGGGLSGLTATKIPVATSATTIGNSTMTFSGNDLTVVGLVNSPQYRFPSTGAYFAAKGAYGMAGYQLNGNPFFGTEGLGAPFEMAIPTQWQTNAEPGNPDPGFTVEWFDGTNKKYKKNVGGTVTSGIIY